MTVGELLREARRELATAPFDVSAREAHLLLGQVLEASEASLLAYPERAVSDEQARRFRSLVERRCHGEPVAYLFGEREFYGRPFYVDDRVLIPRPETEHLVEAALVLDWPERPRILDIGAGSGCLALTLALELTDATMVATDVLLPALRVTGINIRRHELGSRVALVQADLAAALRLERFDLVVSNPPYIDPDDPSTSAEVRAFEPSSALFAENRGRAVLGRLMEAAREMRPGTHLLLEIGYDQADWLRETVDGERALDLVDIVRDYGGIPRSAVVRRTRTES